MNELQIEIPSYINDLEAMKTAVYCGQPFYQFYITLVADDSKKGYHFSWTPCYCYSAENPALKAASVDAPTVKEIICSQKVKQFYYMLTSGDWPMCKNCRAAILQQTLKNIFWTRYVFGAMLSENGYGLTVFDALHFHSAPPLPYTLCLCIDRRCNLACKTCRHDLILNTPKITDDDLADIANVAKMFNSLSVGCDGEFFMSDNYVRLLSYDLTKNSNLKSIVLYSNGILFDENHWNNLNENTRRLIREVKISIDAATPETYLAVRGTGWSRLIKNLEFIQTLKANFNFKLSSTFTISKYNLSDVTKFYEFALSQKIDAVVFQMARPMFNDISVTDFVIPSAEQRDILEYLRELELNSPIGTVTIT